MGYIDDNLVQGEQVIFRTRYHWYVIVRSIFGTIIYISFVYIVAVTMLGYRSLGDLMFDQFVTYALVGLCAFGALMFLSVILTYFSSEFGATNRRVLIKTGVIRRQTLELSLSKIESFRIHESLMGRLFGFKSITLTGSGGTHQRFAYIAKAQEFRQAVTQLGTHLEMSTKNGNLAESPAESLGRTSSILENVVLPDNTNLRIQQAVTEIQAGRLAHARSIVESLVKSAPHNADVWYLVGFLSSTPDRKYQAYNRALSIDPNHRKAREGLAALG